MLSRSFFKSVISFSKLEENPAVLQTHIRCYMATFNLKKKSRQVLPLKSRITRRNDFSSRQKEQEEAAALLFPQPHILVNACMLQTEVEVKYK